MSAKKQNLGLLLGMLGLIVFAGSLPASRIAVSEVTPYLLTAARATIAGFAGLAMLVLTRRSLPPRRAWWPLLICAITIVLGFPLLSAVAMVTVPSSQGGVILGIMPLMTIAAAAVIEGERPSAGFWIAAIIGSALVMGFALYRSGGYTLTAGDLLLLAAVICGGVGYTYSGQLSGLMPGWEVISWAVAISLPISVACLILTWPAEPQSISFRAWGAILYAGLMAQYFGFFLWNAAMAMAGISRIGQIGLLQPFCVVLIAALFAREPIDPTTIGFAVAVVATVAIGTRLRVSRPAAGG
ncbi:DMT family transporter [Pseudorhodoplanes sp.]|uniref:DMT family transporter n=1 Tax=Pseudorhodoplanes sp. TaxID=1934341 RepID=UPI002B8C9A24|nr:DMT family transporter [Pseudorhodoplanes sp.]HWV42107.1 DMT family transporter [Pseudorhodoplanes sp.]